VGRPIATPTLTVNRRYKQTATHRMKAPAGGV
jgi:hypothetical protein